MSVYHDTRLDHSETGQLYGHYVDTFESDGRQVRADLFQADDALVAYVRFENGLDITDVTDRWASCLNQIATERGYEGRLRIVYTNVATYPGNMRLRRG